jgi:hypothetical protein
MKVRRYGPMAVLLMGCMLLIASYDARDCWGGTYQTVLPKYVGHLKELCFWRVSHGQYEASLGRGRFGFCSASKR